MTTTIQVGRDVADALRATAPHLTYDEIIRRLLAGQAVSLLPNTDTAVIYFSMTVNPATKGEQKQRVGVTGYITAAIFHFPPGPAGLVEVRAVLEQGDSDKYIVPSRDNSFVALDDAVYPATGLSIPVKDTDNIRVEWNNYDGGNPHTVPVTILITKVGR